MRSFTQNKFFQMLVLSASLVAVPVAGSYAAEQHSQHRDRMAEGSDPVPPNSFYGPRIDSIRNQIAGIEQGIADAEQGGRISPTEATTLKMRAAKLSATVERTASANGGNLPSPLYQQIMRRFDNLDEHLLADTGAAWDTGDGANSNYPNN